MSAGFAARLAACSTAEDYLTLLDVPHDQRVVDVNRLHILRHFSRRLADLHGTADPVPYREALTASYQAFVTGTSLDHRLFKVLQDRAPQAFVPLSDVGIEAPAVGIEPAAVKGPTC